MKKKIRSLLAATLSITIIVSMSLNAFATESIDHVSTKEVFEQDSVEESNFSVVFANGHFYINENVIMTKMGGGIGRCTVKNKTFKKTFTRKKAKKALRAEQLGLGSYQVLIAALGSYFGLTGLGVSSFMAFFGGESTLVRYLKNFLDSGKSKGKFIFKTHCVNRGYMHGDPMYDYEVDSISIEY